MTLQELIIKRSFKLAVMFIECFHDMKPYEKKVAELHTLEEGTLGKDIAVCLENNKLRLVPGFESHDLKHVLLGFEMTPLDEIRMQAFMLGNGNISVPSVLIFIYGFLLLPNKWRQFYNDFKLGFASLPIKKWTIEEYAHLSTERLRQGLLGRRERKVMVTFPKVAAMSAMLVGIFGMIFCLPYLFSDNLKDLVGAGFPFLAGAIIFSAGLVCFTFLHKRMSNTCPA